LCKSAVYGEDLLLAAAVQYKPDLKRLGGRPRAMTERAARISPALQCLLLAGLSAVLYALLQAAHMPAALLLACMAAGICTSLRDFTIRIPLRVLYVAQGLIGCLMAQSLQPQMLQRVVHDWPVFIGFTALVMAVSVALGWWLSRHQVLPGTTAIWGLAPGAASAMVLMSEAYGADPRLVAFMQYTRVIIVTAVAAVVARLWLGPPDAALPALDWWAVSSTHDLLFTLALVAIGFGFTLLIRSPAGAMMLPLLLGVLGQGVGYAQITLPPGLLALAYAAIGWTIGLRYTRATLSHAWRALPRVLIAIAVLVVFGMALAFGLALLGDIDPLTAYLATSPGGADSVAIIAAHATAVDVGFVMAMQLARFMLVLLLGPGVSRWVALRAAAQHAPAARATD